MKKIFTVLAGMFLACAGNVADATVVKPWFSQWGGEWKANYDAELTYDEDEDEYCLSTFGGVKLYFSYEYDEESGNNIVYITNRQGQYLVDPETWKNASISFTLDGEQVDAQGSHTVELALVGFGDTYVKEGYDAAEKGGSNLLDIAFFGYTETGWWEWAKFYCYFNPKAAENPETAVEAVEATPECFNVYNLMGQKVNAASLDQLGKGIYIVNGKKTLVK